MNSYPHLLSPIQVGPKTYKHRITASPIYCGPFAMLPPLLPVLYNGMVKRARGGCSQVTLGETAVDFEHANREPFPPADYTKFEGEMFDRLSEICRECKDAGAVTLIELSHAGRSRMNVPGAGCPIGPVAGVNEEGAEVVAMDESLMQEVIDHFVQCAKYMQAAGFDGVMIHSGHGWLLHQFLSARTNTRTDEYGGSLENRAKFPIRLLKAVREAMGPDFILEARVSGEECEDGGMGIDETVEYCKMIEPYVDIIHVSVGTYRNPILSGEFSSMYQPHGLNKEAAKKVKQAVSVPVTLVGGICDPDQAEQLIADGYCDMIALGRQVTADPDFANKVASGHADDIAQCIRCFKCFPGPLEGVIDDLSKIFGCTVNPRAFYFDEAVLNSKPEASRNVLVIGGGIAGMTAAITACDRGHKVTLCEASGRLGGLLHFTDTDAYKMGLHSFMELLIRRVESRKIDVRLNTPVTAATLPDYHADAIILAVGSEPTVFPIPGIENAIQAIDAYNRMDELGENVVMLGGGLVGCEFGLHMAKNGKNVTIVEMQDAVAPDSYPMHRLGMLDEMSRMLTVRTGLKCTEVRKNGITAVDKDGNAVEIAGDSVVFALGMKAKASLRDELIAAAGDTKITAVGDCVRASKVYDAGREAFVAAMQIL